mmetsp:Transcript_50253/g.75027  ORF Transcript_50253/g.75027 Transcript_50253/m.75027 type:complete len:88 (-) Transcript_50253:118-381(-)
MEATNDVSMVYHTEYKSRLPSYVVSFIDMMHPQRVTLSVESIPLVFVQAVGRNLLFRKQRVTGRRTQPHVRVVVVDADAQQNESYGS